MGGLIAGAIAGVAGATTSAIAAHKAGKASDEQNRIATAKQTQLDNLTADRPEFTNPYENLKNQFENLDNPYANLTVSTEAFKMQAEQADIALANSLDVMMETGMGAGGATALAQAALQSKKGIAASINAQETANKKLQAQGEKDVAIQRAQGAQQLDMLRAQGNAMEQRDAINFHEAQMTRTATQLDNARQNAMDYNAAKNQALMGIGTSIASGASIIASSESKGKNKGGNNDGDGDEF